MPAGELVMSPAGRSAAGDIAVGTGPPSPGPLDSTGLPLPGTEEATAQVALLNGSDGTLVWSKPGDYPYPVLRAGSPAQPALAAQTSRTESTDDTVTQTLIITAYSTAGDEVYNRSHSLSTPKSPDDAPAFGIGIAVPAGDFEPDGAADGLALLIVASGPNIASKEALFYGAHGTPLGQTNARALGASTTGNGDGIVEVNTVNGLRVTVRRAPDNRILFSRALTGPAGTNSAFAYGARLRPSKCADVIVAAEGPTQVFGAVLASNGQPRWQLRYPRNDLRAGTVTKPAAAPQPTCA
jgi:hypothetical protein